MHWVWYSYIFGITCSVPVFYAVNPFFNTSGSVRFFPVYPLLFANFRPNCVIFILTISIVLTSHIDL